MPVLSSHLSKQPANQMLPSQMSNSSPPRKPDAVQRSAGTRMTQVVKHLAAAYTGRGGLPSPHPERVGWPHQLKAAAEAVGEQLPPAMSSLSPDEPISEVAIVTVGAQSLLLQSGPGLHDSAWSSVESGLHTSRASPTGRCCCCCGQGTSRCHRTAVQQAAHAPGAERQVKDSSEPE